MTWALVIMLAFTGLAFAVLVTRHSRGGVGVVGLALALGLAGYAFQASPSVRGAPAKVADRLLEADSSSVEARKEMVADDAHSRSELVPEADTLFLQGRYAEAAALLQNLLTDNPDDVEAYLALGNVMVERADGMLTPPAVLAYRRAAAIDPGGVAAGYFLGRALLRQGQLKEGLDVWQGTLEIAAPHAPGRNLLEQRTSQLKSLLAPFMSEVAR